MLLKQETLINILMLILKVFLFDIDALIAKTEMYSNIFLFKFSFLLKSLNSFVFIMCTP